MFVVLGAFQKIVKEGRDFACSVYKAQPGALIRTPMSDGLQFLWDSICDYPDNPNGLPARAAPPFSGGQCECVVYNVTVEIEYRGDEVDPTKVTTQLVDVVRAGVIKGLRARSIGNQGGVLEQFVIETESARGMVQGVCNQTMIFQEVYRVPRVVSYKITKIVRQDGLPDTCGNPPSGYPVVPPPPPEGYTSPPVNINLGNGTSINVIFNLKPPTQLPPPALFLPPVIVNFLKLGINPEFNIPISFNFDGSINFGKGGDDGKFSQDDRDTIKNIKNVTNNTNNTVNNVSNEINNVTNYNNNKPPNPNDFELPPPPKPPGEHQKSYLAAVEIRLTQIPRNAKTQSGEGAPDVVYAGWFEWRRAGKYTPREPIHFQGSVFLAPKGVDGYAWTLYDGFVGVAQEVINKEKV